MKMALSIKKAISTDTKKINLRRFIICSCFYEQFEVVNQGCRTPYYGKMVWMVLNVV